MSKSRHFETRSRGTPGRDAQSVAGKVTHDSRGNAVWDWALDTGVLDRTSTAELLKALHAPGSLDLEQEAGHNAHGWTGDPYNRPIR